MNKKAASAKKASSVKKVTASHQKKSIDVTTDLLVTNTSGKNRTTSIPNLLKNRPFYIKFF